MSDNPSQPAPEERPMDDTPDQPVSEQPAPEETPIGEPRIESAAAETPAEEAMPPAPPEATSIMDEAAEPAAEIPPAVVEPAPAAATVPAVPEEAESNFYRRWLLADRIEHWTFMASFTTLAITGLVQKFSTSPLSQWVVKTLGGIETTRTIHHVAAVIMLLCVIYHIGEVVYKLYVRRSRPNMLPGWQDVVNGYHALMYNLGFRKNRPQQGRYGFEEKMEYWAVVWGTFVMALSGFMMWNPIATTKALPGEAIPAAKMAHGWEAVLAVLAIILWHLYNVLVRTINKSMFTGNLTEEEMLHEHPLELADIKAGVAQRPTTAEGRRRRSRIFFPVYAVFGAIMLVGVYYFVAYEDTAIATVPPPETAEIFAPLPPTPLPTPVPTPTTLPGGLTSWEGGVGALLNSRCVICHNNTGKIGGLDLSSYETTLAGGKSGPAVVPGDAANSQLVIKQSAGGHPGQLSADELQQIVDWINNGAPQR